MEIKHLIYPSCKSHSDKSLLKNQINKIGISLIIQLFITKVVLSYFLSFVILYLFQPSIKDIEFNSSYLLYLSCAIFSILGTIPFIKIYKHNISKNIFKTTKLNYKLLFNSFCIVIFLQNITGFIILIIDKYSCNLISSTSPHFKIQSNFSLDTICAFITICIVIPVIEEFIFRGVILNLLKKYGESFATIISSIFFGLYHTNIKQTFIAFFIGLVLGFVFIKSQSITPSILLHSTNNILAFILSVNKNSHFSMLMIYSCLSILISLYGFILLILKIYKFTLNDGDYKLFLSEKYKLAFSSKPVLIYISLILFSIIYDIIYLLD